MWSTYSHTGIICMLVSFGWARVASPSALRIWYLYPLIVLISYSSVTPRTAHDTGRLVPGYSQAGVTMGHIYMYKKQEACPGMYGIGILEEGVLAC